MLVESYKKRFERRKRLVTRPACVDPTIKVSICFMSKSQVSHTGKKPRFRGSLTPPLAALALGVSFVATACGNAGRGDDEQSSAQQPSISDPEFANLAAKLAEPERARLVEFLADVHCSERCSIGDMAFVSRADVADYFYEHVLSSHDKGLVVSSSRRWTGPITVCWTTDSNASAADKAAVIANVEQTWKAYANVTFDWYSSGTTPRTCNSTQAPSYNLKIWQDTSQTRGCSYVGKNTAVGIGCSGSVAHSYANVLLEAGKGTKRDSYVAVHEIGHAIGIYHEQDRTDSTCTSGVAALAAGARDVGSYDPESIMNYCAASNGNISSGDVGSATLLYSGRSLNATFATHAWAPTDVTFTATHSDLTTQTATQSNASGTRTDFSFGATQTGAVMSIVPSNSSLRCRLQTVAPYLRNNADKVLFSGVSSFAADCYSPAIISTFL